MTVPGHGDAIQLTASELVARLREAVRVSFAATIPQGPVCLVDYPDHSNVGDSAIWLGEMAYLDDAGRVPAYSAALADYRAAELANAAPEGPILIHGGGNFGTTWPRHEAFRLDLLRQFPGRPIVQLPQSVFYGDRDSSGAMADAIGRHGAFTLMVRDARSQEYARRHFGCPVVLCPDPALYLGMRQRAKPNVDVLALLRTDHESLQDAAPVPADVVALDWLRDPPLARRFLRWRFKVASRLASDPQGSRLKRHRALAAWRLQRGLGILSRGRVVVTDRLHAHILSLLLDVTHVVLDNSYGKIGDFAAQWSHNYRGLHRARSRSEAFAHARTLAMLT